MCNPTIVGLNRTRLWERDSEKENISLTLANVTACQLMMMANMSGQRSDPTNEEGCIRVLSLDDFIHLSLIPAFVIVLVLSLCQRRANAGPDSWCGGRPGLLVPANLLDDNRHRLAYACAFGATATSCLTLFGGSYCPPGTPGWLAVFYAIAKVAELGIDYYPFFACMSASCRLPGAAIGLLYSVIWLLFYLSHAAECLDNPNLWYFPGQPLVEQLPVLICLLILVLQYARTCMGELLNRCRPHGAATSLPEQRIRLSGHHVTHIRDLLRRRTPAEELQRRKQ
ncbi:stimulated by retinoic acid gene 6 protein-like [Branchiostoma lanceolatum]|uniref:stimulated by retinoic acid gene 6 protein-like n=1 Tax=Branchiostoma lanceolatum TaxID=7740 RepID=UPI003453CC4A